ncbi:ZIP family metal transporter [Natrialba swarupiae]|uniref:ZIP family metal transporter n=1 Tax=Natrialba swarupiae TaxID=2448032 RepID=A0A5D5AMA4_9EURY|nr:ZIP family metal transporter [Natrialba swarupiae]TYT61997.1 ZIP family metal transporter [Natrialba swarupiae]
MTSLVEVVVIATIAGCATGLGALPTLVTDRVSHRVYDGALGLAGGIMVGAAVFALVLPGLELGTPLEVVAGVLLGGAFLLVTNAVLPHLHLWFRDDRLEGTTVLEPVGGNSGSDPSPTTVRRGETDDTDGRADSEDDLRRAALVGSAVTIHNVPEGLAVGIAFASGETALGLAIATAIAVQNVPDGFAIAVPAARAGLSRSKTLLYTTLSGGVPEPIAAAAGFALVAVVTGLFPIAAGFAAGAMIAVVFRELVPSSHGHGYADTATATFVLGFAIMLIVDTTLAV